MENVTREYLTKLFYPPFGLLAISTTLMGCSQQAYVPQNSVRSMPQYQNTINSISTIDETEENHTANNVVRVADVAPIITRALPMPEANETNTALANIVPAINLPAFKSTSSTTISPILLGVDTVYANPVYANPVAVIPVAVKPASISTAQTAQSQERLGTKWGDDIYASITHIDLPRTTYEPLEQIQVHYADKNYAGRAINSISLLGGKIDFSIVGDRASALPMFRDNGHYYVRGRAGQAYSLKYHNNTDDTFEIVASVDGLDVLTGNTASRYTEGYLLYPHDNLAIEGFRKSPDTVASFIFSQPERAYAANTINGAISNAGMIDTTIYELVNPSLEDAYKNTVLQAFPADSGSSSSDRGYRYAQPPH